MPDAARVGDHHICPAHGNTDAPAHPPPKPKQGQAAAPTGPGQAHTGGPIQPECAPTVEVNSKAQARATDALLCQGVSKKNYIVTGSGTVEINGKMAARVTDRTMHPPAGTIDKGSANVEIGGPTEGATLGSSEATAACEAAKCDRDTTATFPEGDVNAGKLINPTGVTQSYNNCGLESVRQIINRVRGEGGLSPLTEDQLLSHATLSNRATYDPVDLRSSGRSSPADQVALLQDNHIEASRVFAQAPAELAPQLAEGHGVVVSVWASDFWSEDEAKAANLAPGTQTGSHVVLLTGIEYDDEGNPINAIVNDTGQGKCGQKVPLDRLDAALMKDNGQIVTKQPIW